MPVKSNDIAMEPVSTDDWDNSLYSEFDWNDLNLCDLPKLDYTTHPDEFDFIPMEPMQSPKQQIRHHDCMWSGTCVDKSHPGKMKFCSANAAASGGGTSSNSATTASSTTTNTTAAASVKTTAASNINGLNINSNNNNSISKINNNNNTAATATILNNKMNTIKAQQIPAGRSLLLNSRLNQKHNNNNNNNSNYNNNTNNQQQHNNNNTMICDGGGGGDGNNNNNNYYKQQKPQQQQQQHLTRPDTPLSLDDDVPEFKHEINTTTPECPITGSGRMHFIPETMTSSQIISMLREHLEDDNRNLDIGSIINTVTSAPKENAFLDILTDLKYLSDYEELDEDSAIDMDSGDSDNTDNIHYNNGLLLQQQCQQQLQQEQQHQQYNHHTDLLSHQIKTEIDDDCDYDDETLHNGSIISTRMNSNGNTNTNSYDSHVGDHSYTKPEKEKRPKNRVDTHKFGIDTPSDSDEEIDVVSVTDKTLPTNPSARDRRALQTTVAHKISAAARMNKSASGAMQQQQQKTMRSISQQQTPRRRCSDDDDDMLSTTSTSSSHSMTNGTTMKLNHRNYNHQQSVSSSSSPNSGYVSSSSSNCNYNSNYKYTMQQSSTISSSSSSTHNNATTQKMSGGTASRKRQQHQITNKDSYSSKMHSSNSSHNSSKRNRSKKQKMSSSNGHSSANQSSSSLSPNKRIASDCDEADTLEKRNLHNDMERQRRIGLKNLFEELKAQIPSIRDKERAPKVNILREAAALCNKLSRDNEQHVMLKKQQNRLIARVKHLRTSLATQRRC